MLLRTYILLYGKNIHSVLHTETLHGIIITLKYNEIHYTQYQTKELCAFAMQQFSDQKDRVKKCISSRATLL